jgi:hypothetical protein
MRFYFDRCVPIRIARMVRGLDGHEHEFRHQDEDERFPPEMEDIDWLRGLRADGQPLWVVLSGDGRILKKKREREVLDETRLPFFCFDKPWPNTPIYEYAWKFIKVWPRILEAAKQGEGTIFRVSGGAALNIDQLQ